MSYFAKIKQFMTLKLLLILDPRPQLTPSVPCMSLGGGRRRRRPASTSGYVYRFVIIRLDYYEI